MENLCDRQGSDPAAMPVRPKAAPLRPDRQSDCLPNHNLVYCRCACGGPTSTFSMAEMEVQEDVFHPETHSTFCDDMDPYLQALPLLNILRHRQIVATVDTSEGKSTF